MLNELEDGHPGSANLNKNRVLAIIAVIFCLVLGVCIHSKDLELRILRDRRVVCARMTGIENPAKGGRYITFEFVMDGKRYRSGCGLYDKLEYNYRHGRFDIWVALEKAHPNNNRVLVDSGDFEQFEVNEKDTAGIACNYY